MKTKLPSLVSILVLTVITSVMWIGLGIYRSFTQEQTPSVPDNVSQELNPALDKAAIEKIKTKSFINAGEVPSTIIVATTPSATPLVFPSISPAASASASAEPSPTQTSEGGVTP